MSVDLVSLQVMAIFGNERDRELVRKGAGLVKVPVDVREADSGGAAQSDIKSNEVDVVLLDATIPPEQRTSFVSAARVARPAAFIILVTEYDSESEVSQEEVAAVDGTVHKPATLGEAKALIERCIRVRVPTRVLVVDDSSTMRSIVRKILTASRFPLEIAEAEEGIAALKQIGSARFDMVFLDYHMPGLNGVETLAEIKRQFPRLQVVMITSNDDQEVAERARTAGAAAFLKKPFYPSDIDMVLRSLYGLRQSRAA